MNGPLASVIGSIALAIAGYIAGWLGSHNIIPAADINTDTALISTAILGAMGSAVIWFKQRQVSQAAMIKAINDSKDNGLKVVRDNEENANVPTVTAPLAVPPAAPPLKALLFAFLILGALIALDGGTTAARADSLDLVTGLKSKGVHLPINLGAPSSTDPASSAEGTAADDDLLKIFTDANKKVMDKLGSISRAMLVLFGTGDGAIAESLQYPDLQDGNGHDCAVQGQRFSTIIHDHPLALTGHMIDDLENQRIMFSAAAKVCNAPSCQAVFGELSAQVNKVATGANGLVSGGIGLIPGIGTAASAGGALGTALSSQNLFTMACNTLGNISLVPPTITVTPTPTPTVAPVSAPATNTGIVPPSMTPTPTPSPTVTP